MIIADICPFKGAMICIELTGGCLRENMKIYIHRDIVGENMLSCGMEVSEDDVDRLIYSNDLRRARERALYLLEGRDYSYSELFDKLEENYPEEICFEICGKMKELGLINDRRYAEKLCRQYFEVKRWGCYRVKMEMRRKGIPDDLITEVMEEFAEDDDILERLEELVDRKYARYLVDRKGVNKVRGALLRLGYSYDQIKEVLDLYDLDFDE